MKIKKGDNIIIIKGKDRGKTGQVENVFPNKGLISVTGLNVFKKHIKPNQKNPHGGIVDINCPVNKANVMIICPRCNKATRVGYKLSGQTKSRICQKCQESLEVK